MTASFTPQSLAKRLKNETSAEHEYMHQLMAKNQVFEDKQNYAQFTLAQYYFQKNIEVLFGLSEVSALISDLDIRGRSQAALLDLQDLAVQPENLELETETTDFHAALGWIYVSEGSTLGAAFLFRQAERAFGFSGEFAARNLAAYPEGRAKVWKHFIEELDRADFSSAEQDRVVEGAKQAFNYYGLLLQKAH